MSEPSDQPKCIAHYRVVRHLGSGGMGQVLLAEDTKLDRPVALKLLPKEVAADATRRKRFLAEAQSAAALNHSSVCTIYEVGETAEGQPFIAMEYLEGQTLDALARRRRLELREIVGIGMQVADALEAARQHQVVHRDIKPGNMMMDAQGRVKVLDFGLVKRLDQPSDAPTLTQEGAIVGTPNYLSPEMALGREVAARSDIFSLGVVLYELSAGRNPFAGASFGETVNNILNKDPDPLKPWNPTVTGEFERIVRKCLEKDPAKRYGTPAQLRDELGTLNSSLQTPRSSNRLVLAVAAIVVALGVIGLGTLWLGRSTPARQPPSPGRNLTMVPQKSVAVLPFVNLSPDKENEYLSDGLTEDLCTALTQVKGLRVPARTSSFVFKGKTDDIRKIGEQLSVATVLEGSVTKAGNRLRVTAQLIDVANGYHLWATNYDREMTDILEIRSDIAQQVVAALKVQLGVEETHTLTKRPTENLEAYRLYLQGRYLWNRRTNESLKQAIACFNEAIGKDPSYALAYAGLADSYVVLDVYTGQPIRETHPKARAAALKALELDNTLAEPRTTLAYIKAYSDWDWSGAEAEFRRAIALNPNYATPHHWLGTLLLVLRRPAEALAECRRALEIDPLSPNLNAALGFRLFQNGQVDLAIEVLQKQIALDPAYAGARETLGLVYLDIGKLSEAIAEFETTRRLLGSETDELACLAVAHARAGRTNEARRFLDQMHGIQRKGLDYRVGIAWVLHTLDDEEGALGSLEQGLAEHASGLESLNYDPCWDDLRPHPRAQAILRKMNLAPELAVSRTTLDPKSVAVLPFVNMSSDKENEYLSDGLTEELLNSLAKVKGLRVPARTSCFVFKGKTDDIRRIGEQLSVATVLEGSVRKAGDQLRITAQLINVADDSHLWSDTYDRDMTNIFAIQSDIASRVAEALKVQLLGAARDPTRNIEAYKLYLQGRSLWNRRTTESLNQAIALFNQAIAKDPGYALAYAGLADCYVVLRDYDVHTSDRQSYPQALAAALKALELDSSLPGPHAAIASAKAHLDWDWSGAEVEFRRAIELDPNYATAHQWLGLVLRALRRPEEAMAEFKRALEIDPLSPVINVNLAETLCHNGQTDLAIDALQKQIAFDPSFVPAHQLLAAVYWHKGKLSECAAELETARKLLGSDMSMLAFLASVRARTGNTNEARKLLGQMENLQRQGLNYRGGIAGVQHVLGDDEAALASLERAVEEHASDLEYLNFDLFWKDLRPHPRVQAILRKMNLVK